MFVVCAIFFRLNVYKQSHSIAYRKRARPFFISVLYSASLSLKSKHTDAQHSFQLFLIALRPITNREAFIFVDG